MMRVVGKVGFVAVVLSLITTASVYASPTGRAASMTSAMLAEDYSSVGPRTFLGTGFEPAEGYVVGSISTQQGWFCSGRSNAFPPGPGCPGTQVGPNPFNSGGIVAKGNGSSQSLFVTQNLNFPNNTGRGAFSPNFKDFTLNTMNIDYRLDDNFGADYTIIPQAPSQGKRITNIYFYYTGQMYILDDLDGHGPGTGLTYRSVGAWQADTWQTLEMVLDKASRTFTVSQGADKLHQTPLCYNAGANCTYDLGATLAVGLGDQFEMVVILTDNNQNTGLGSFSGAADAGMYVDNLALKQTPEPASLVLLAAGALLALRRKTAR